MARETILIVDDNPLNLKLLNVLLVGEGYDVQTRTMPKGVGDSSRVSSAAHSHGRSTAGRRRRL